MPEDYTEILERGIQLRMAAKTLEEEAASHKSEANKLFEVALNISGQEKLTHERGTLTRSPNVRNTLNKEKLVQVLVTRGVKADVVADSITEATETTVGKPKLTFREKKSKEE